MISTGTLQQLYGIVNQLQNPADGVNQAIATSALDSIFYELEQELDGLIKDELLTFGYLRAHLDQCDELTAQAGSGLKTLKTVRFMNGTQFYCFLRLKKIFINLSVFQTRYEGLIAEFSEFDPAPKAGKGNRNSPGDQSGKFSKKTVGCPDGTPKLQS